MKITYCKTPVFLLNTSHWKGWKVIRSICLPSPHLCNPLTTFYNSGLQPGERKWVKRDYVMLASLLGKKVVCDSVMQHTLSFPICPNKLLFWMKFQQEWDEIESSRDMRRGIQTAGILPSPPHRCQYPWEEKGVNQEQRELLYLLQSRALKLSLWICWPLLSHSFALQNILFLQSYPFSLISLNIYVIAKAVSCKT